MDYTAARHQDEMADALIQMPDAPAQAIARFRRARAVARRTHTALEKNKTRRAHIGFIRYIYEVPPPPSTPDPRHRATRNRGD